jgi:hypothetical protein
MSSPSTLLNGDVDDIRWLSVGDGAQPESVDE